MRNAVPRALVVGLVALLFATGCGPHRTRAFRTRELGLQSAARFNLRSGLAVAGGPYDTEYFLPRFTMNLPRAWRVTADDEGLWELTDGYNAPGLTDSEMSFLHIYRLSGITDNMLVSSNEFYSDPLGHTRPLPANLMLWLKAQPYLKITELSPARLAGNPVDRARLAVLDRPSTPLGIYDCPCVAPFVFAGDPIANDPRGNTLRFVAGVESEVRFVDIGADRLLLEIDAPSASFTTFAAQVDALLATLRFR